MECRLGGCFETGLFAGTTTDVQTLFRPPIVDLEKTMKFKLALIAAALLASTGAAAQTTSVFDLTSGSFSNAYTFTMATDFDLVGDTNSTGISWFGVLLQAPTIPFSDIDFNPDDGFSFSGLSAGTYALTFLGSGTGGYGGFYTITPVPEPQTYAMLVGGLGLLGLMSNRRRRG